MSDKMQEFKDTLEIASESSALRVSDDGAHAHLVDMHTEALRENAVLRESNGQRLEEIVRLRTENADLRSQLAEARGFTEVTRKWLPASPGIEHFQAEQEAPPKDEARTLTDEQLQEGLHQARRIIRDAVGYYYGGECTPFGPAFKALALRALDQQDAALAEALKDVERVESALSEMDRAYDPAIFTPLSDADVKKLVKAMGHNTDVRAPSDRLHAGWGRHLVGVIRRRVEEMRADAAMAAAQEKPNE